MWCRRWWELLWLVMEVISVGHGGKGVVCLVELLGGVLPGSGALPWVGGGEW